MKLSRLVFIIAAVIVGVWLLGLLLKAAAWLINGLVYIAAIILIIGLIGRYLEKRRKPGKPTYKSNVIDIDGK